MSEAIPVHIVMVLDRSGSMSPLATDLIGGVNKFIGDQKAKPGKCRMTLVQFDGDDPFEIIHDAVQIGQVANLTSRVYQPRGSTPLLDAEGKAITRMETREAERKAKGKKEEAVLFVTFTDGQENASREWSHARLSEAKKRCEEKGWTFLYLGVGHDGYGQSHSIGTQFGNTQMASASSVGIQAVMDSMSHVTTAVRGSSLSGDRQTLLRAASKGAYETYGIVKEAEAKMDEDEKAKTKTPS